MQKTSKSGWLQKASEDKKKWQKRWVELDGHRLTYAAKQGKTVDGMLDLHGVLECRAVPAEGKVKNVVCLRTKQRDWSFAAETEAEMNEWVKILRDYLGRLDKEFALVRVPPRSEEEPQGEVVNALEELPEEAKVIVRAMGITREQLTNPKDFPTLLNILSFQIGRRLISTKFKNAHETAENASAGGSTYSTDALSAGRRWVQETMVRTFEKTYKLSPNKLGEGGYGTVFQAQRGKDRNATVAVKKSENRDDRARATNLRELFYLMTLDSPHFVKCYDCFDMPEQGQMWAVLEYMDGGTLTQARKNHVWTPPEVAYIARELLRGISVLHGKEIIHRDIKSSNVMFTVSGEVKLIDFGLATNFPVAGQKLRGIVGSAFWIAPEMIRGLRHDHKCDVWSAAMCLLELVNGHIPHLDDESLKENAPTGAKGSRAMFLVGSGVAPPIGHTRPDVWKANADVAAFFAAMMEFDPQRRPEAASLLTHAFIKQACTQDAIKKMLLEVFRGQAMSVF